jgi:hypothetical protein
VLVLVLVLVFLSFFACHLQRSRTSTSTIKN